MVALKGVIGTHRLSRTVTLIFGDSRYFFFSSILSEVMMILTFRYKSSPPLYIYISVQPIDAYSTIYVVRHLPQHWHSFQKIGAMAVKIRQGVYFWLRMTRCMGKASVASTIIDQFSAFYTPPSPALFSFSLTRSLALSLLLFLPSLSHFASLCCYFLLLSHQLSSWASDNPRYREQNRRNVHPSTAG